MSPPQNALSEGQLSVSSLRLQLPFDTFTSPVFQESPDGKLVKCTICSRFDTPESRSQHGSNWIQPNNAATHLESLEHSRCAAAFEWNTVRTRRRLGRAVPDMHPRDVNTATAEWVPAMVKNAVARSTTHRREDPTSIATQGNWGPWTR